MIKGIIAIMSIIITIIIVLITLTIPCIYLYGLIIAFTSHIATGIIALLIPPLAFIIGLTQIFEYEMANELTRFITNF